MPDQKISELNAGAPITGTKVVPSVREPIQ